MFFGGDSFERYPIKSVHDYYDIHRGVLFDRMLELIRGCPRADAGG